LPGKVGRYSFSHALIRETLYEELSATRRVRLHRRIGEALEGLHADDVDSHLSELAYHFLRAALGGDVEKAADYSLRAGWHAVDQLAFEDAAGHFERGLEALELVEGDVAEDQRCKLLLGLGAAQSKAGDFAESKESFQAAAELARRLGDAEKLAHAALGFGEGLGGIGYAVTTDPETVKLFEEALAGMSEEDSPLRVRVLSRLATELYYTPGVDRRDALTREAVEMADRIGDPESRLFALYSRLWALLGPDTVEERLDGSAEVLRLAAEVGDAEMEFRGHWTRITALIDRGDIDALDAELLACDRLAEELRQPLYQSYAASFHTAYALIRGRLDEAEGLAEEALAQAGGHEGIFHIVSAQLAGVYWVRGRMGELEDATKEFVEGYPDLLAWRAALAMIYTEQGRRPEAREQLELLGEENFGRLPRDGHWTTCVGLCIWTAAFVGDAERAEQLYKLLLPHRDQTVVAAGGTLCIGPAPLFLAAAAATAERFDEAAENFELAIERCERMGARPFLAQALHDYAGMLRKRGDSGDRERAAELASSSLALARELGMEGVAERAGALVEELESAQPSGSAAG
jgi:tetratricopeptide (TPR) repeat protein